MAGGSFTIQNKIRPGAYIKTIGQLGSSDLTGNRGIVTFAAPLGWGKENELIEISVDTLTDGSLERLIGAGIYDEASKLVRAALSNAHTVLLYRGDIGGDKAEASIEIATSKNMEVETKYAGEVGNKISIEIKSTIDSKYEVITYLGSVARHNQTVSKLSELVDNDYVIFTNKEEDTTITKTAVPTLLTGGTNGTFDSSAYMSYLNILKESVFNILACYDFGDTSAFTLESILTFIKTMRETKGVKIQAVMQNANLANYEGIISTAGQGVQFTSGEELDGKEFVIWVAGATAGATAYQDNTYKTINGATKITNDVLESDIEGLIKSGFLVISKNRSGNIVIEKDINTLVTMREDTTELFSLNKTIRLLDEIANKVAIDFENNYIGKVNNDQSGRNLFKASIISYLTSLQTAGGIINFNSSEDVTVLPGEQPDAFYAEILVQPTYAVTKLYMIINVQ